MRAEDDEGRPRVRPDASDPALDLELVERLFSAASVGMAVLDTDLRYRRVNDVLAQMNGVPAAAHVGRSIPELLPDLDTEGVIALFARVLETGEPATEHEVRGSTPADPGTQHVWLESAYRLEDKDGTPLGVGVVVVDITSQRQVEEMRRIASERLAVLARASDILSTSLDPHRTVDALCDLITPRLADHVFVDLADDSGRLVRAGIKHADDMAVDPALVRPLGEPVQYADDHPVAVAVRTGETIHRPTLEGRPDLVPPGKDTEFVRRSSARSAAILPMVVAGSVVGVVSVLHSGSGRTFGTEDVALLRQLVSRAAIAVSNARAYEQQRDAAEALQRSLLPTDLRVRDGVAIAWRYVPGTAGTEVGGDWVDVIELSGGRTALVVGDVMGRGLRAAAVMGQLRTATRVLAQQDLPPAQVLRQLDIVVASMPSTQLATCAYAVYDPARGSLNVASAGHLPLLVQRGGAVERIEGTVGLPLGAGSTTGDSAADSDYESVTVALPAGSTVALYTDGLVETRGVDIDRGIDALASALTDGRDLDAICQHALDLVAEHSGPGALEDDAALLVARALAGQGDRVALRRLPATASSAGEGRRMLREALERWDVDPADEAAASLMVSELVTNAVRYTVSDVELLVRLGTGYLVVEVADDDTRLPRLLHADLFDEGGRGLALVAMLSTSWGARPTETGKVVWFTLDVAMAGERTRPSARELP